MTLDGRRQGWILLAIAAALVVAFHALGDAYAGWSLGLGTIDEPTPRYTLFLFYYVGIGSVTALCLAAGLALVRRREASERWEGWDDRRFLVATVAAAFLIPAALRMLVLAGAPLTDDEGLYRFMAKVLLRGDVTAPSHELKLFFDHAFMVNDGRMYSQYFMGWPALLSLGVLVGAPGFMNAALSAATVPALYFLVRDLAGRTWGQVTVLVFLTSPMLQLLAATEMSHTSALGALTWTAWLARRAVADPSRLGSHALVALAFSAAFFIRPLTALGVGGPFLVYWALGCLRDEGRLRRLAAFAAPAAVMAALFLLVNRGQTGSAFQPAYMGWQEYARANAFRFSGLNPETAPTVPNMRLTDFTGAARIVALGLSRLNFALLGWPASLLFLPLAWGARRSLVFWAAIGSFLLLHLPLRDAGIDTMGPVHFTELALPVLVLTALALRRGVDWLEGHGLPGHRVGLAAVNALVLCGLFMYTPARLKAVSVIATLVHVPTVVAEASGVRDAVVFVAHPFTARCNPAIPVPSRPFVLWWPPNEPDLSDDIVYANHLSVEADRRLMERFPGRSGWIQHWRPDCTVEFVPLDQARSETMPNGMMTRTIGHATFFDERHPLTGEVPAGFDPLGAGAR